MKKLYILASIFLIINTSQAQLLMHEPFNYTPHPTDGLWVQSGAVWLRINSGDSILVDNNSLTYPGLATSTGNKAKYDAAGSDYYRTFAAQTSGTVYYSFILNVSSLSTHTTTGGYFTSLVQGSSTTSYGGAVWTRASTTAGKFNVGVSTRSNSAVSWLSADLNPGTSYFIVAAYEIITGTANDVAKIWLNTAAIGGTQPAPDATSVVGTDLSAAGIDKVLLRQDNTSNTPFIEIDEIRVGTSWADVTPASAATPTITISSPLTAFGNVCINTTAGPNSFTISGTNLTTANVTVGALPGFTYSTTSGGTYATSLSLTQPGGTYTQEIFVKFDPTAVQSYNGNIPVAGGGFTGPVNAAATGAGVNTLATVTSGVASAITSTTATVAGAISANGCSAVTAYGIEYSTTSGFANGTGTPVASTNLAAGNFSSDLAGLVAGTTYYYHAYATNSGGTAYGAELFFATAAAIPTLSATTLAPFGNVCTNASGGPNSFTLTGSNLSTVSIDINALPGFLYSTTSGGSYTATLNIPQPGGTFSQEIFVEFHPGLVQSFDGNILISGGGASSINVFASGSGIDPVPALTTGGASLITQTSATLTGTITNTGCTAISAYGIEYSTTSGFTNGTGTPIAATNLAAGNFSSDLAGLVPGTTYYYHAYATNTAGTGYGTEQTFTTVSPNPVITTSSLTAFGNVCINATAGPNSFTITGTNLTNADITVAALAGYSYSTTAGGTYTATLTFTQPGGSFSQEVFVRFAPTAVQSYDGNIVVNGGGISSPVNVAASGAGVNTIPLVTSGSASAITSISATVAGSITNTGCSAITAYGIEYSTTSGFANGTGTPVASTNLAGGNFTSALAGLSPTTTYYYHAFATNAGGTGYGTEQSFVTLTPSISTSALTAFGNVCTNTTAGPNSFTITGSNLTAANVTVAALAGYTYSTTAGGTYTATLSLTQPGGAYSQQIFVRFTPTAIQSYNGNIAVNGGGIIAPVNVAASGAGVNTAATVTTGAATAITQTTATTAGSITANGCSAVTAYGIEYSTTNNFANGSGTQVASTNIAAGNFTSALSGLTPSTVYYYKAFATNSAGTVWGTQQTFTTTAPTLSVTSLTGFGDVCVNTTVGPNSFTITGVALSTVNISIGALAGYTYSTTAGGTYSPSLSLVQPGGAYSQQIFVRFTPTLVQSYNGNIAVGGGGAATTNVAATGNGINTLATVTTGGISTLTTHSVVAAGTLGVSGCSSITSYGIEYSGINGFVNGAGTKVASTNLAGTAFTSTLNGLVQGATYYYRAYATNNGGTSYGVQQSFTLPTIGLGLNMYPNPALRGKDVRVTMNNLTPGYYGLRFYNNEGRLVYQKDMNIQVGFINQSFTVPATLARGIYRVQLVSHLKVIDTESIYIL